jgi:hypothetical protein
MISGAWISQAIFVAAKLRIADLVQDEPRSAADLAEAANVHPRALYRVLRALASVDIFTEQDDGRFGLTPMAGFLRSEEPRSLRPFAIMMGSEWVWQSWGEIMHSVAGETPAFDKLYGAPLFDYWARHPEAARIDIEGLTSRSAAENAAIVSAYDFSKAATIVDVGGGQGSLLAAILAANPKSQGTLFDMPHVIATASIILEKAGVAGRCELVAGTFFQSIPTGRDIYVIKKVIHDWDDKQATAILRTIRAAIPDGGRLLLMEPVIAPGNEPSYAKLLDLLMLVYPGGRERTEAEHRELLGGAGFSLQRAVPTASPITILEAVPA